MNASASLPTRMMVDRFDGVALVDPVDHLLPFYNPAKHRVLVVQVGCGDMGDEELAAISAGTSIGHGENTGAVVAQARVEFIGKGVAGTAGAGTQRATALDHEVGDHPVEGQAVVKRGAGGFAAAAKMEAAFRQADEIDDRQRCLVVRESEQDVAL